MTRTQISFYRSNGPANCPPYNTWFPTSFAEKMLNSENTTKHGQKRWLQVLTRTNKWFGVSR